MHPGFPGSGTSQGLQADDQVKKILIYKTQSNNVYQILHSLPLSKALCYQSAPSTDTDTLHIASIIWKRTCQNWVDCMLFFHALFLSKTKLMLNWGSKNENNMVKAWKSIPVNIPCETMFVKNLSSSANESPLKKSTFSLQLSLFFSFAKRGRLQPYSTAYLTCKSGFCSLAAHISSVRTVSDDKCEYVHFLAIFEVISCRLGRGSNANRAYTFGPDHLKLNSLS